MLVGNPTPGKAASLANLAPAWGPGQSGNPKGRAKGSRNQLAEDFIFALQQDFAEHGVAAIEQVRDERPDQYLKVIASLMPKDINLNINDDIEMTDDEIIQRVRDLTATVAPLLIGTRIAGGGDEAQASAEGIADIY